MKKKTFVSMVIAIFALSLCLAACSPSGDKASQEFEVWSPSVDCGMCHTSEQESTTDFEAIAAMHDGAGIGCIGCHVDTTSLESAHENVDESSKKPRRLSQTSVPIETCLTSACHMSYEDLAEKTKSYQQDSIEVNPHAQSVDPTVGTRVDPHTTPQAKPIDCGQCHMAHEKSLGLSYCYTCHHNQEFEPCSTCHVESS